MNFEAMRTRDRSLTFFNKKWGEHYHSMSMGAYSEALHKHVLPPLLLRPELLTLPRIRILDICFGLGYNTLVSLKEYKNRAFKGVLEIYSPEIDRELLAQLWDFEYPAELAETMPYLHQLLESQSVCADGVHLELFIGDAREYLRAIPADFDVVYQDAFSPARNPLLWSVEYFTELRAILKNEGIVTTYTQSSAMRYGAHLAGFNVYEYHNGLDRAGTILSPTILPLRRVDLERKLHHNPALKPLNDEECRQE